MAIQLFSLISNNVYFLLPIPKVQEIKKIDKFEQINFRRKELIAWVNEQYNKEYLQKDLAFDHFQPFLTGAIDVSLAIENAVVAANSLGTGYLVTNDTYTRDLNKIFGIFNIPETGCFPLLYLCLGYPKDLNIAPKSRIDKKHIVHHGKYNDYAQAELVSMINEYNNPELELFTHWKGKGYQSYLDWFYSKWIPALENPDKSSILVDTIKRIGFLK